MGPGRLVWDGLCPFRAPNSVPPCYRGFSVWSKRGIEFNSAFDLLNSVESIEPYSKDLQVQDANNQGCHVSNSIWELICHYRSQGRLFSCRDYITTQKIPQVHFCRQSGAIQSTSFWPSSISPQIHLDSRAFMSSMTSTISSYLPSRGIWQFSIKISSSPI